MSAYRPANAAGSVRPGGGLLVTGRILAAIGGILLIAGVVDIRVAQVGSEYFVEEWSETVNFLVPLVAGIILTGVAVWAVVSARLVTDLFTLAATGWALAWNGDQNLQRVGTLLQGAPQINWRFLAVSGVGLLLGVAAVLVLSGIAVAARYGGQGAEVLVSHAPPPGWHPDPSGAADVMRWWDGTAWTSHTTQAQRVT